MDFFPCFIMLYKSKEEEKGLQQQVVEVWCGCKDTSWSKTSPMEDAGFEN